MGLMTLAMAVLTIAGAGGVLALAALDPSAAMRALALLAAGTAIAAVAEQIDKGLRRAAPRGRSSAWAAAILPIALQLGFQALSWNAGERGVLGAPSSAASMLATYLVATGPWTIIGALAPRRFRTVREIRAFGGHLAFWLLALGAGLLGLWRPAAVMLTACAAVLPVGVAFLVARADPEVIRRVRV